MSYSDPAANFAPPPPPPARRSPWMWVGLGCGSIVVLFFVLVAVFVAQVKKGLDRPFDSKTAVAAMGDLPVYPGAVLDPQMSKAQQSAMQVMKFAMPSDSLNVIAYQVPGPSEEIMTWYDSAMEKRGYKIATATDETMEKFSRGTRQNQYTKGKDRVLIQVQKSPRVTGQFYLLAMRFVNFRGNQ